MSACEGCGTSPAPLQCPTCKELSLPPSLFCTQKCFKASWKEHKEKHTASSSAAGGGGSDLCNVRTMRDHDKMMFNFRGPLRPGLTSSKRQVPDTIPRPDYALSAEGESLTEQKAYKVNRAERQTGAKLQGIRHAAAVTREILDIACEAVVPGITTESIDKIVHEATIARGGYPSTLNYYKFPKSCCTSINEVVCHGIPDSTVLQQGDIVNLDISAYVGGYHGDCNETVFVGKPVTKRAKTTATTTTAGNLNNNNNNSLPAASSSIASLESDGITNNTALTMSSTSSSTTVNNAEVTTTQQTVEEEEEMIDSESIRLVHVTYRAMLAAIAICKPGTMYKHIGEAVEAVTEPHGFGVVRSVCGHGIGELFHCPPNVAHYRGNKNMGAMANGHVFTIEPMVNAGSWKDITWPDNWTISTADGKRSAQFEHMVLVTSDGSEILTKSKKFDKPFYQIQLEQWGLVPPPDF